MPISSNDDKINMTGVTVCSRAKINVKKYIHICFFRTPFKKPVIFSYC